MSSSSPQVFSDSDFGSDSGMSTFVWGPALWHFLHTMSFNYPTRPTEEDKRKYVGFMQRLGDILPCRFCRENLPDNLRSVGFCSADMASRDRFSRLIYRLHEEVNRRLGKPVGQLTYEEVRDRYENFRARTCSSSAPAVVTTEQGCDTGIDQPKQRCFLRIDHRDIPGKETLSVNPTCCARRR